MPASQSKISFDAINIVKAENIYLNDSRDRNVKRKCTATDEIVNLKKKIVSDFVLKPLNPGTSTKPKKCVPKETTKSKNASLTAAKKTRKRQMDIGNAYSKLNSQLQNQPKPPECPKVVLGETSSSRSFYVTPRQTFLKPEIDFENINPNKLPEHFYESELDDFIRTQYPDFEDSSEYDFQDPLPLANFDLPPETFHPQNSLKHFKELLDQEESSKNKLLEKSEIELLKNIIKADERYQKLKSDDYLILKEILMGQLKEISEQERVIKMALDKLRSRRHSEVKINNLNVGVVNAEKPLENNSKESNLENVPLTRSEFYKTKTEKGNAVSRQEVDVFFKNVPSLEREIRILRLLGQKLEETLKKSNDKKIAIKPPLILLSTQCISFKHCICIASYTALPFASQSILGLVQEFKICHQTIEELKLERDFFIPIDLNNFNLQRTNFDMLRHNPELLLRRLKPITKDSRLKFNIIEQDPLFFNHFLANICKISSNSFTTHGTFIPQNHSLNYKSNIIPTMAMNGAGDHFDFVLKEDDLPKLEPPIVLENSSRTIIKEKKLKKCRTPLQEKKFVSSKNSLIKIILLGSLHLTIVLMVFTAFFYPDIICL